MLLASCTFDTVMLKRLPLVAIVLLIVLLLQLVLLQIGLAASPAPFTPASDISEAHYTVYPNPTFGTLNVVVEPNHYDRFTVVNILGQIIVDSQIPPTVQRLHFDLSEEPQGTYFFAFYRQGEIAVTKKLMRQ